MNMNTIMHEVVEARSSALRSQLLSLVWSRLVINIPPNWLILTTILIIGSSEYILYHVGNILLVDAGSIIVIDAILYFLQSVVMLTLHPFVFRPSIF